ncbi:hypothetical protein KL86CLO1_11377 [uncultured Eubacteriales bacterium]|uniref:Uncharacterized protein n=1 Tax=uncultured Eubacteriales bacterium TaxID=172733 RepID=A0A212JN00_9FIRM|nr:hypothetical protein KL86CLO1_11377 [uncultured Eubacteriales bacterium]
MLDCAYFTEFTVMKLALTRESKNIDISLKPSNLLI